MSERARVKKLQELIPTIANGPSGGIGWTPDMIRLMRDSAAERLIELIRAIVNDELSKRDPHV